MKKITLVLGALFSLFIISCEGPEGPSGLNGFDGENGQDGKSLGTVIDIVGTFTLENDYTIAFEFPQTVEVFESDVILVYLLWGQTEDGNGDPVDIWRLLPQTRILDQGLLQYNFDHTFFNVNIFLESDFDLETLLVGDTDNQVFRVAIIPSDFSSGKMDKSNIVSVMGSLGIEEKDVQKIMLN